MKRARDEAPTKLIAARPRAPVEATTTAAEAPPEEAVLTFSEGEGEGGGDAAVLPHEASTQSTPHPPRQACWLGDVPGELLGAYIVPGLRWSDLVREYD